MSFQLENYNGLGRLNLNDLAMLREPVKRSSVADLYRNGGYVTTAGLSTVKTPDPIDDGSFADAAISSIAAASIENNVIQPTYEPIVSRDPNTGLAYQGGIYSGGPLYEEVYVQEGSPTSIVQQQPAVMAKPSRTSLVIGALAIGLFLKSKGVF